MIMKVIIVSHDEFSKNCLMLIIYLFDSMQLYFILYFYIS